MLGYFETGHEREEHLINVIVIYQVLAALFILALILSTGYYLGYRRNVRAYQKMSASDREEMLTIERALKGFWDYEKDKLIKEREELERRVQFLEDRLDQYRRKAAGIGMMGLRKSKLSDMLITLLLENETLEEKLFLQNLKLKEERDQFLENDLRNISYKRILLSELLNQSGVRREMERVLKEKSNLKRLDVKGRRLEPTTFLAHDKEEEALD
jgi:uncharacterized membrane protein